MKKEFKSDFENNSDFYKAVTNYFLENNGKTSAPWALDSTGLGMAKSMAEFGAEWADKHPRKNLVEINKIYIWLSDFLDKCYIEDRGEAKEINADLVLKSFLKVAKGE